MISRAICQLDTMIPKATCPGLDLMIPRATCQLDTMISRLLRMWKSVTRSFSTKLPLIIKSYKSGSAPYMMVLKVTPKKWRKTRNKRSYSVRSSVRPRCRLRTPPGQEAFADLANFAGQSRTVCLLSQSPLRSKWNVLADSIDFDGEPVLRLWDWVGSRARGKRKNRTIVHRSQAMEPCQFCLPMITKRHTLELILIFEINLPVQFAPQTPSWESRVPGKVFQKEWSSFLLTMKPMIHRGKDSNDRTQNWRLQNLLWVVGQSGLPTQSQMESLLLEHYARCTMFPCTTERGTALHSNKT